MRVSAGGVCFESSESLSSVSTGDLNLLNLLNLLLMVRVIGVDRPLCPAGISPDSGAKPAHGKHLAMKQQRQQFSHPALPRLPA